jgi:hypothetical protein
MQILQQSTCNSVPSMSDVYFTFTAWLTANAPVIHHHRQSEINLSMYKRWWTLFAYSPILLRILTAFRSCEQNSLYFLSAVSSFTDDHRSQRDPSTLPASRLESAAWLVSFSHFSLFLAKWVSSVFLPFSTSFYSVFLSDLVFASNNKR